MPVKTSQQTAYNADGQRILKEYVGHSWQFYVMDGMSRNFGTVLDQNGLSHFNIVGNGTEGRVSLDGSNLTDRRYYLKDHLGSTREVISASGATLETFDYYPFGLLMPKRNTTDAGTLEQFTGKERDTEADLNLDYFGARYYDAAIGRWNGVDPLADKFPNMSPYNYVENDPVNYLDPNGAYKIVGGNFGGKPVVKATRIKISTVRRWNISSSIGSALFGPLAIPQMMAKGIRNDPSWQNNGYDYTTLVGGVYSKAIKSISMSSAGNLLGNILGGSITGTDIAVNIATRSTPKEIALDNLAFSTVGNVKLGGMDSNFFQMDESGDLQVDEKVISAIGLDLSEKLAGEYLDNAKNLINGFANGMNLDVRSEKDQKKLLRYISNNEELFNKVLNEMVHGNRE